MTRRLCDGAWCVLFIALAATMGCAPSPAPDVGAPGGAEGGVDVLQADHTTQPDAALSRLDGPIDAASAPMDASTDAPVARDVIRRDASLPPPTGESLPGSTPPPSPRVFGDNNPVPGDNVRFTLPVYFPRSGRRDLVIDADGTLWAWGGWFTPRVNGDPRWRLLSGVDRTGRLIFEVEREGEVRVEQVLPRPDGVYVFFAAYRGARIAGVEVPSREGARNDDRYLAAFDRDGALRWIRRVGTGWDAALAARGSQVVVVVGVPTGEYGGSDGSGLVPASRGGEIFAIDIDASGAPLRTRRLPSNTDQPYPTTAVFHGDGRLTAINSSSTASNAWTWSADGALLWSPTFVGASALAPNGQVAVHGVLGELGECATRALDSTPNGEHESSCALVFDDGRPILQVSPVRYVRGEWRLPRVYRWSLGVHATSQAFVFTSFYSDEVYPWPECASSPTYRYVQSGDALLGRRVVPQWRSASDGSSMPLVIGPGGGRSCWYRPYDLSSDTDTRIFPFSRAVLSCAPSGHASETYTFRVTCDGRETDLETDPTNCGGCGRACSSSPDGVAETCRHGICVAVGCVPTRGDCDGRRENGCESDLTREQAHCGVCGNACDPGSRCVSGRCCVGDRCGGPYPSTGADGAFAPQRDVTLRSGRHDFTTMSVPEGVTVRVAAGGVLDLRASGSVRIDGTLDLRGAPGQSGCTAVAGGTAGVRGGPGDGAGCGANVGGGPAGGESLRVGNLDNPHIGCQFSSCDPHGPLGLWPIEYDGAAPRACALCVGSRCAGPSVSRSAGSGGSIGAAAIRDLAVQTTFYPGSGGGVHEAMVPDVHATGGGAGGALRIASLIGIELGPRAAIHVEGGAGWRSAVHGGDGSAGVIVLSAPSVRVTSGAVVSADGLNGRGLGRVRVAADPTRCSLDGTLRPPLMNGCALSDPTSALGHTLVTRWPY